MTRRQRRWPVRLHYVLACAWAVGGIIAFPTGLADSIVLVWIASVYANVAGDLGAAAAADDGKVLAELAALRADINALRKQLDAKGGAA